MPLEIRPEAVNVSFQKHQEKQLRVHVISHSWLVTQTKESFPWNGKVFWADSEDSFKITQQKQPSCLRSTCYGTNVKPAALAAGAQSAAEITLAASLLRATGLVDLVDNLLWTSKCSDVPIFSKGANNRRLKVTTEPVWLFQSSGDFHVLSSQRSSWSPWDWRAGWPALSGPPWRQNPSLRRDVLSYCWRFPERVPAR